MKLCSAQYHKQTGLCATDDMKCQGHVKYYELLDLKLCCSAVQHKGGKASLLQVGCNPASRLSEVHCHKGKCHLDSNGDKLLCMQYVWRPELLQAALRSRLLCGDCPMH